MPEKEIITLMVQEALNNTTSFEDFISQIQLEGYEVYTRGGVPHGVIGKRKYRFTSLGISLERFSRLEKSLERIITQIGDR